MSEKKRSFVKVYAVPEFKHGDLVKAKGYGEEILQIDSFTIESHRHADSEWDYDAVVYDLTFLSTGDMAIAEQADVQLVAPAKEADEYKKTNGIKDLNEPFADIYAINLAFAESSKSKQAESKHRDKEKEEVKRRKDYRKKTDELLDKYNRTKSEAVMNEIKMRGVIFQAGGHLQEGDE